MSPSKNDAHTRRVTYNRRLKVRLERLHARCEGVISRIAMGRLIAFLSTIFCAIVMVNDRVYQPWLPLGLVSAGLFILAVILHRKPYRLSPRIELRIRTVSEAIARLEHRWDELEDSGLEYTTPERPELEELQVFGPVSLFQVAQPRRLTLEPRSAGVSPDGWDVGGRNR